MAVTLILGPTLLLVLGAAPAAGMRTMDFAFVGGQPQTRFELNLSDAQPPGLTAFIPLNKSARILEASLQFGASPSFQSTLIKGWGIPERNQEDFGTPVEGEGDYNNDGYADVAVGAPMRLVPNEPGRVDVYYGGPAGIGLLPSWSYIGSSGIQFAGVLSHGDISNDGFDDLLVGEQNANYQGTPPERAYAFYGSAAGLPSSPSLVYVSETPNVNSGWANSITAGDLNGDSFVDLVVPELITNGSSYASKIWVYWGSANGVSPANLTFAYAPGPSFFEFGFPIFELGDSDGDGLFEVATGKQTYHDGWTGIVVMEGVRNSTSINFTWNYNGSFGRQVRDGFAGGGDLTGDGLPDFVAGHSLVNSGAGAIGIFPGLPNGSYNNTPSVVMNWTREGESFSSDACLGDFDGDGWVDLLVGASHDYSDAEGGAYLFTERQYDQNEASYFTGSPPGLAEAFGSSTTSLGDVNGDGIDDFAVTAEFGYNGSSQPGTVRVYYGNRHLFPENVSISLGGAEIWSKTGRFKSANVTVNLTATLQNYLDANGAAANATGIVNIPLNFQFAQGGRLVASKILVRYSVVLPPDGARAASDPSGDAIIVSWSLRSPPSDGTLVTIESNKTGAWARLAVVGAVRGVFVDTDVVTGSTFHYRVSEWDTVAGVFSAAAAVVSATAVDSRPPLVPALLPLELDIPNQAVTVRWLPNGDDTASYEVWRQAGDTQSPELLATLSAAQAAYRDQGLPEETNLTYSVRAIDEAGLASAQSEPLTARLPDLADPLSPRSLRATPLASGTEVSLNWTLNAADTVRYDVWVSAPNVASSFTLAGSTAGSAFDVRGLVRGATYTFRVQAVDQAGHRSLNATATAQTADLLGPRAPLITRVAAPPQGKTVEVEWTSSDDDVTDFIVSWSSGGGPISSAEVDSTRRSFDITGLVDDISVQVRVRARDLAGHEGPDSIPVTAVPHDGLPPGTPTAVTVIAVAEGGALRVEWHPPADTDIAGYKVFFRTGSTGLFALAGAVGGASTTFTHRGLSNGVSHAYVVSAIDGAVNEGSPSAPAAGTPADTQAPAPPVLDPLPSVTAELQLEVTGYSEPLTGVEIQLNDALVGTATTFPGGSFSFRVTLVEGDNIIRARAVDSRAGVGSQATVGEFAPEVHVIVDIDPPLFDAVEPPDGASGLGLRPVFKLHADEALDPSALQVTLRSSDGDQVAVDIAYDAATHTVAVTPLVDLHASTTYLLSISGADAAGNALEPRNYSFSTQGAETPLFAYAASAAALVGGAGGAILLRRRANAPAERASK